MLSTHSVFFCDFLFCLQFMVIMNLLGVKRLGKYHSDYIHNRFTPFPDSVCFLHHCHATPTSPPSKSIRCHQHISYLHARWIPYSQTQEDVNTNTGYHDGHSGLGPSLLLISLPILCPKILFQSCHIEFSCMQSSSH